MSFCLRILSLCLFGYTSCLGENYWRVIGTNLYDFSAVAATTNRNTPYRLVGLVDHVYTQSVKLLIPTGKYEYRFEPVTASTEPSEMLAWVSAAKIGEKPITPGQYMALSPRLSQHFQRHQITHVAYVLHCPFTVKPEDVIEVLVIPTTAPGYYDCGVEATGSVTNFQTIHRVLLNRIVQQPLGPTNAPPSEVSPPPRPIRKVTLPT